MLNFLVFCFYSIHVYASSECLTNSTELNAHVRQINITTQEAIRVRVSEKVRSEGEHFLENFECHAGFYGEECQPCDCLHPFICDDGRNGTGHCDCALHHYGPTCTSCACHGFPCDDGLSGSGACACPGGAFWDSSLCECARGYQRDTVAVSPRSVVTSGNDASLALFMDKSRQFVLSSGKVISASWMRFDLGVGERVIALRYSRFLNDSIPFFHVPYHLWVAGSSTGREGTWELLSISTNPVRTTTQVSLLSSQGVFSVWFPVTTLASFRYLLVAWTSTPLATRIPVRSLEVFTDRTESVECIPVPLPVHAPPGEVLRYPEVTVSTEQGAVVPGVVTSTSMNAPSLDVVLERPFFLYSIHYQRRLYDNVTFPWGNNLIPQRTWIKGRSSEDASLWDLIGEHVHSDTAEDVVRRSSGSHVFSLTTLTRPTRAYSSFRWLASSLHAFPVDRLVLVGAWEEPYRIEEPCPLKRDALGWGWQRTGEPCHCQGEFMGPECSECGCQNGGECTSHGCLCLPPWGGSTCSHLVPVRCDVSYCSAEGTTHTSPLCDFMTVLTIGPWWGQTSSFPRCRCEEAYEGPMCERKVVCEDYCSPDSFTGCSFRRTGFYGDTWEVDICSL